MLDENTLIEVPISPRNKIYYENLGYEIPKYYDKKNCRWAVKRGTKIFVKLKDIPKGSNVKLVVKCENVLCEECHKNFHKQYGYGNNTQEQFYEYSRICGEG